MTDNALKAISSNAEEIRVANYLVLWGDQQRRDLEGLASERVNPDGSHGEYFTPETDFTSEFTKAGKLLVDWEHRADPEVGGEVLGFVDWSTAKSDDRGLWVERVLYRRSRYVQMLEDLITAGLIGNSSEAMVEGVEKDEDGRIKSWPLIRDSLTVSPMEPRMITENVLEAVKSASEVIPELKALIPESESSSLSPEPVEAEEPGEVDESTSSVKVEEVSEGVSAASPEATIEASVTEAKHISVIAREEKSIMEDNENKDQAQHDESRIDRMETMLDNLSKAVNQVLQVMQDEPAVRKAGFYSEDGGKDQTVKKSFADWLLAVQRGDTVRLKSVYASGAGKALNEQVGSAGAYTVPDEFNTRLLEVGYTQSPILSLINPIPVAVDSGEWPALDQYTAPTAGAGNTAFAAGVKPTKVAEAGALTETEPSFEMISWRLHDVGGYTQVTANLASDSPLAIEALLTRLFGVAVAARKEYYILRGNGNAEPLGILNSPAAIGVTTATDNQFGYVDAVGMLSRFKKITPNARFVAHQSIYPDFAGSQWTQGDAVRSISDLGMGDLVLSEHLPQANNAGDVLLADFGAYLLFEKGNVEIAYSEHYGFINRLGTWRFFSRMDGKPWVKNTITLADPQGSFTVSPFVYHND